MARLTKISTFGFFAFCSLVSCAPRHTQVNEDTKVIGYSAARWQVAHQVLEVRLSKGLPSIPNECYEMRDALRGHFKLGSTMDEVKKELGPPDTPVHKNEFGDPCMGYDLGVLENDYFVEDVFVFDRHGRLVNVNDSEE
jgi:hypothetical protein